jgi:hypothetical protein
MQFGGAQPPESLHQAESTRKRVNQPSYFWRASIKPTVLGDGTLPLWWNGAKAFLGACSLFLSLESGKDSLQKLSCCVIKTGPFSRLITAQSQIFFCPGRRPGSPYDAARGHRKVSFSCVYLLLMAQCAVSADSSYFIVRTRLTHRLAYCPYGLA